MLLEKVFRCYTKQYIQNLFFSHNNYWKHKMKKLVKLCLFIVVLSGCMSVHAKETGKEQINKKRPVDYILPMVGTQGEGNTFPGATAPFGMLQLSPDTENKLSEAASGYKYADGSIMGFSLTHFNGTGVPDLGDFLFTPIVGTPKYIPGPKAHPDSGYRSPFLHTNETASAGYYSVKLSNSVVKVELTAGDRAGFLRFTFPKTDSAFILTDLKHVLKWDVIWSNVRVLDNKTITGYHLVSGWAKERHLFFAARYSRPFDDYAIISDGKKVYYNTFRFRSRSEAAGKNLQFYAQYNTKANEVILVKVAVSAVSAANALQNLDDEIKDWDFEALHNKTKEKWEKEVSKIKIEGSEEEKEIFYTSMYHAFLNPSLYQDVNGEYRGLDQNTHKDKKNSNYAIFSLWDTYRATHPLFTLIQAGRDADMINSMLAHYDQSVDHLLPVWSLQGNETWCMIGYHAVPVIVDACMKHLKGFNYERAYEAIKTTAMNPDYDNVMTYAKLGWVPYDKENESISKTLEYAYDDYCVAVMAKSLGKKDDYNYFMKRAGNYKNLFDKSNNLMRAKDSKGEWLSPFNPHEYPNRSGITEGNNWQYSWYVPHDIPGLIALHGGKEKFIQKLDSLFIFDVVPGSIEDQDFQGRIGEYFHGNEPSHHIAYLYTIAGQPWKTQKLIHQIMKTQYGNKPNSLCGNDDCGQMSAWYIFSALGFYPVCPGSNLYVIGSPSLKKAEINLSNGKKFVTVAEGLTSENIYIQSVTLNGKTWNKPYIPHEEIAKGGRLVYKMGPKPNTSWGIEANIPN